MLYEKMSCSFFYKMKFFILLMFIFNCMIIIGCAESGDKKPSTISQPVIPPSDPTNPFKPIMFTVGVINNTGEIFPYDGNTFQNLTIDSEITKSNYNGLNSVYGFSTKDVFAVGDDGRIWHYDGALWTSFNANDIVPSPVKFYGVWGSAGNNVFAVGDKATIVHYDGKNWKVVTTNTEVVYTFRGIWGSSSYDVFVVGGRPPEYGQCCDEAIILHYDGLTWSVQYKKEGYILNGIWGSASNDVFAVGKESTTIHYDGANWISMGTNTSADSLNGVFGTSRNNVYSISKLGNIYRYDGTKWTLSLEAKPFSDFTNPLHGIYGNSPVNIFAVGDGGTIIRYDGSSWSLVKGITSSIKLNSVWMPNQ